jgi:RNA polymerase sigma-70 factor (ECF subfamily)
MKIRQNDQDEELLKRSAKGDEDAFTVLYRRHADVLYRFAFRMTGSSWGAEEIVQDVFMTLVREPSKYEAERGTLPAFLFGVTRNKIMSTTSACHGRFLWWSARKTAAAAG